MIQVRLQTVKLNDVTGNKPEVTDYVMVECVAKCPACKRPVNEKTSVEVQE